MGDQPLDGTDPSAPDAAPRDPARPAYPPPPPYPIGYQPSPYPPPAGPSQPLYPPPPGYGPPMQLMQPVGYGGLSYPAPQDEGAGMAIAGLILGLVGVPLSMIPGCGLLFGILGLVFSMLGRKSVSRRSLATAGIVLSCISLGIFALQFMSGIIGSLRP